MQESVSGRDFAGILILLKSGYLGGMREADRTRVLGWPGYRVYQHEINEAAKTLKLWVRRKRGNRKLICSGCGRKLAEAYDSYEREVRDLPCLEFRTTVNPNLLATTGRLKVRNDSTILIARFIVCPPLF